MTSFDPLYVGRLKFEFKHSDNSIKFKSKFELRIQFELQYLNSKVINKGENLDFIDNKHILHCHYNIQK
jgi:hypothetical protein